MAQLRVRQLDDLVVFLRAVERGGFSQAARELHRTPGAVSKQVARLEGALGVRLFERSTRSMRVTDEGRAAAARVREVLLQLEQIAELGQRGRDALEGTIRITAPVPLGRHYVASAVAEFCTLHPRLQVELRLSDQIFDLLGGDLDLALRIGALRSSSLVARPLLTYRRLLVAAPSYLAAHGTPKTPADLSKHDCLVFAYPGLLQNGWSFTRGRRRERVAVRSKLRSDNGDVLQAWCTAGLGISLREPWDVTEQLSRGRLVRVLPSWQVEPTVLHAVRVHKSHGTRRVEAFLDFLQDRWRDDGLR